MQILIASTRPDHTLHSIFESALSQRLILDGHQVKFAKCLLEDTPCSKWLTRKKSELDNFSDIDLSHASKSCRDCKFLFEAVLGSEHILSFDESPHCPEIPDYSAQDAITTIRSLYINDDLANIPLSYQVWITEYLCWTRNDLLGMLAFPNLDYINFLIRESQTKLHQALSYICNYKPDLLIVYNGRLIASRAWIVAADIMGLKYICHERGALDGSFRLYPFSDCGDRVLKNFPKPNLLAEQRPKSWVEAYVADKRLLKDTNLSYYNKGYVQGDNSAVQGSLSDFDICFLPSSHDELSYPISVDWPEYQLELLLSLCESADLSMRVVIRFHPRQSLHLGELRNVLEGLQSDHVHMTRYESVLFNILQRYRHKLQNGSLCLIMPWSTITSYSLFSSGVLLAPFSMIAGEALVAGCKVSVCTSNIFSESASHLFSLSDEPSQVINDLTYKFRSGLLQSPNIDKALNIFEENIIRPSFVIPGLDYSKWSGFGRDAHEECIPDIQAAVQSLQLKRVSNYIQKV